MKSLKAGVIGRGRIRNIYFKTLRKYDAVEVVTRASLAPQIEEHLSHIKTRPIPMNIDGRLPQFTPRLALTPHSRTDCSACLGQWASWPAPGSRPNKTAATKALYLNDPSEK